MKATAFDYIRPSSARHAAQLLRDAAGDGKIIAGGQSLLPVLALRMASPSILIDVNRIPGLSRIEHPDTATLRIGALVRHQDLISQHRHPLLANAARWIGHTAIRSRGTVGGSIAHADPSAELPAVAVATGATMTVTGPDATRQIAADDLFVGALQTCLADDEMITSIDFPIPHRWGFAEFARRHGDFALVTAVVCETGAGPRIAIGGVGSVPQRAPRAEAALRGDGPLSARLQAAIDAVAGDVEPGDDLHATARHRRALAMEMLRRALRQAYPTDEGDRR